jgi:hypothetical protein
MFGCCSGDASREMAIRPTINKKKAVIANNKNHFLIKTMG